MFRFIIICLILLYIVYDRYYERLLEYMGTSSTDVFKWSCIIILLIICLIPRLDQKIYNSWDYVRKMPSKTKNEYKYNLAYQNNFQNQGLQYGNSLGNSLSSSFGNHYNNPYNIPYNNQNINSPLGEENNELGYTNINLPSD